MSDYTAKQIEYISSVGGHAHISAVEIIGAIENQLTAETARADGLQSALNAAEKQYQDAIAEVAIYMDRAERTDDLTDALAAATARADAAEARYDGLKKDYDWLTQFQKEDKP